MTQSHEYMTRVNARTVDAYTALTIAGFHTFQHNGQRISINLRFFSDAEFIERLEDNEIFIGHLPRDSFEDEFLARMLEAGRVFKIRWMLDFSGNSRGYAFIKYVTPEEATSAVLHLDRYQIRQGRATIGAKKSLDSKVLYVDNLPDWITHEKLLSFLSKNEVKGVVGVLLDNNNNHPTSNGGGGGNPINSYHRFNRHNQIDMNQMRINKNNRHLAMHLTYPQLKQSNFINNNHPLSGLQRQQQLLNRRRSPHGTKLGFILFESHAAATKARRILLPGDSIIGDKKLTFDWACSDVSQIDLQRLKGFHMNVSLLLE